MQKKFKMILSSFIISFYILALFTISFPQQAKNQKFIYLSPQFDNFQFWENGWISYLKGSKWGIMDSNGNILLKPQFDEIHPIVFIGSSIMGIENKIYKGIFAILQNGKVGFIDSKINIIAKPILDSLEVINPWLNVYICEKDGKYGFLNLDKKVFIPPQFDKMYFVQILSFNPNTKYNLPHVVYGNYCLSVVELKDGVWPGWYIQYFLVSKDGKFGAIDTLGNSFVECQYDSFENVLSNQKFKNVLDNSINQQNSESKQKKSDPLPDSISWQLAGQKYKLIFHKSGKTLESKEAFDNVKGIGINNVMAVYKNKKWGIVDINGKWTIKPMFDDIGEFSEGLCSIKQNGKWGFINQNFKIAINPQFDSVRNFQEGCAAVHQNKYWGYINSSGNYILKPQFVEASSFFAEMASVVIKGYTIGLIDKKGNFIVKFPAKNSNYTIVESETFRFRYAPEYTNTSADFIMYKSLLKFPKFGYVVIDKKSNKVGLVLRKLPLD
ncbi:WG repeat-containing protein [Caldicellulosiruptoraceae bacterium PP1]